MPDSVEADAAVPDGGDRAARRSRVALTVMLDHPLPATTGLHMRMIGNLAAVRAVADRSVALWFSTSDRPSRDAGELARHCDEARHAGARVEQSSYSRASRAMRKASWALVAATGYPRTSYPFSQRYDAAGAAASVAAHAAAVDADVVVLPSQGMHWLDHLPSSVDVVVDAADVLTDVTHRLATTSTTSPLRRLGLWINHFASRRQERRYFALATEVWVTSSAEAERVAEIAPSACTLVVPNTAASTCPAVSAQANRGAVGIVATWSYRPNLDALDRLLDGIVPRWVERESGGRLVVAGRDLPKSYLRRCERHPNVDVLGEVADVGDFYSLIDAVVLPIDVRGGVPLKLIEALGRGVPVVASPALVDGIDLRHGVEVVVACSDDEFADCVIQVMGNEQLRRCLSDSGRAVWHRLFSPHARDDAVVDGSVLCR